jgi:nucleoside-diphosphate-sugar epimerase
MAATALVIGGTGPTGPEVVRVLRELGYDVTVLHRGTHEPADAPILAQVEHVHADPHFLDTLTAGLGRREFDVVVASYGRMTVNVAALSGRCGQFVGVGGNPLHPGLLDRGTTWPSGMRLLADETDAVVATQAQTPRQRFAAKVAAAERAVMEAHQRGAFIATYLRYPTVYGRRGLGSVERAVLARLAAGRDRLLVPDGGLAITSRLADRNAAHCVRLALGNPAAAGEVFQCADDEQYSLSQWVELICAAAGRTVPLVSVPSELAWPVRDLLPTGVSGSPHVLVSTAKARDRLGYRDVVRPREVLAETVERLLEQPGDLATVEVDDAAEDALLADLDKLAARYGSGTEEERTGRFLHVYDHPSAAATADQE